MCVKKIINWIKMALTKVHGGLDESFTSVVQYSSQMSNYALTNHTHNQYSPTTHVHTNLINVSQSGNVYFANSNGISFGSAVSGNSTTITASVFGGNITPAPSNIFFVNTNGHSFVSSANAQSTYWWIKTN